MFYCIDDDLIHEWFSIKDLEIYIDNRWILLDYECLERKSIYNKIVQIKLPIKNDVVLIQDPNLILKNHFKGVLKEFSKRRISDFTLGDWSDSFL